MTKYSPEWYQRYKVTIKRAQKAYAERNPDKMREDDRRRKRYYREVRTLRSINVS